MQTTGVKRQRVENGNTIWTRTHAGVGDLVILQRGHKENHFVTLELGGLFQHAYGLFRHDSIIGQPFGSRLYPDSRSGDSSKKMRKGTAPRGELQLLSVTPEIWTRTLQHRTQILYAPDCAIIAAQLHLRPGMKVAETGTGSGSLTTSIARTLGCSGRLHTFEFNEARVAAAKEDFKALGLNEVVTVHHRDTCKEGFMNHGEDDKLFDAVFLDLPQPWLAIPHAKTALKPFARICSFSPCIEQVQRTSLTMSALGFTEIRTFTALGREVRSYINETPVAVAVKIAPIKKSNSEVQAVKSENTSKNAEEYVPKLKRLTYEVETKEGMYSEPYTEMAGHTGYLTFAYRSVN